MVNAGIKGSPDGFNWQSLEQRAEKIKALSAENNIYSGALLFLDVHMHNEIVEALSTKGKNWSSCSYYVLCCNDSLLYPGEKIYTFGFPCFYYVIWH